MLKIILLFLLPFAFTHALKCYTCQNCKEPFDEKFAKISDCPKGCSKTDTFGGRKRKVTSRHCEMDAPVAALILETVSNYTSETYEDYCILAEVNDIKASVISKSVYCVCHTESCNKSASLQKNVFAAFLGQILIFSRLLFG